MKYSLSFLAVFAATAHGAQSARSWVVNTHALEDCSDPTPVGYTGFDVTLMDNQIRPIQFPEGTRAIWFRDSDTAAHVLDLHDRHKARSCTCVCGVNGFSLSPAPHSSTIVLRSPDTALALVMPDAEFYAWNLGRRQQIYAHATTTVAACALAQPWLCGFGVITTVIETIFLVYEIARYSQHRAGDKRDLHSLIDGPIERDDMIEGKKVILKTVDVNDPLSKSDAFSLIGRDLEESHIYITVDVIDDITGEIEHAFADFNPATNETIASAPASGGLGRVGDGHLTRRQANAEDYTVHYQSYNIDSAAAGFFPMRSDTAQKLAGEIWDWGREQNLGGKCAALVRQGQQLNNGYFSIRTGPFTAHRDC